MLWTAWPLDRIIILLVSLAYLLLFVQVTMFHSRQNFRNIAMWAPVIGGALIGSVALLLALVNISVLLGVVKVLFWIGALAGLVGFFYHVRGVGQRVDGYVWRNFLVGPPVILPLMFSALGVVGLFAAYWR